MTPGQLHDGLRTLAAIYKIDHVGSTIDWPSEQMGETEANMHELVHGICLGDPRFAGDVEAYMPKQHAARVAQELKTLRVQRCLFEIANLPLTCLRARRLFRAAHFDGEKVPLASFEAPLTDQEKKLARSTLRLIEDAIKLLEFEV